MGENLFMMHAFRLFNILFLFLTCFTHKKICHEIVMVDSIEMFEIFSSTYCDCVKFKKSWILS